MFRLLTCKLPEFVLLKAYCKYGQYTIEIEYAEQFENYLIYIYHSTNIYKKCIDCYVIDKNYLLFDCDKKYIKYSIINNYLFGV